jgi:hypothetical protein
MGACLAHIFGRNGSGTANDSCQNLLVCLFYDGGSNLFGYCLNRRFSRIPAFEDGYLNLAK